VGETRVRVLLESKVEDERRYARTALRLGRSGPVLALRIYTSAAKTYTKPLRLERLDWSV
jgi:hypothetical protein